MEDGDAVKHGAPDQFGNCPNGLDAGQQFTLLRSELKRLDRWPNGQLDAVGFGNEWNYDTPSASLLLSFIC